VTRAPERLVEVAPGVWVATSRRYDTTSTVLVGDDGTALVVDPAWDPDELAGIPADLAALGVTCGAGLATHLHYDHVLWHPGLGAPPRHASRWTVWATTARRDEVLAPLVGDLPPDLIDLAARLVPVDGGRAPHLVPPATTPRPVTVLPEPYPVPWPGREVLLHEHDAHAPAHVAVEVVDRSVVLAGDMLSDVELPMPDDGNPDLVAYLAGLDRLEEVVRRCALLIPGHGTPTDHALARVDADRRYLDDLLRHGDSDDPRRGLPGMAELHESNVRRAAAQRAGQAG
jgi:glyoxylase-like metal-dependent hydrolase (beta-lactamase superfamily II)